MGGFTLRPVILFGLTGSGKTTILNYLTSHYNYNKIISFTTRPRRIGEVNGEDYWFITPEEFENRLRTGFFAEHSIQHPYGVKSYYGTYLGDISDFCDNVRIGIQNPTGLIQILDKWHRPILIHIDTPEEVCIRRCLDRGDSAEEIGRRMVYDKPLFNSLITYLRLHKIEYHRIESYLSKSLSAVKINKIINEEMMKNGIEEPSGNLSKQQQNESE